MGTVNLILLAVSLVLQTCLLLVLFRRRIYWQFPAFFAYTAYSVIATAALLVTNSHYGAYFYAFWINEAGLAVLAILVLREVFRRVFFGFYVQFRWFRLLFPGVVLLALLLVFWDAHNLALRGSFLRKAILLFGVAVNFIQAGLFCLFIVLGRTFWLRWRFAPLGILLGFTLSALASALDYWAVSEFGTRYEIFTKYFPPVAYIFSIGVWLDTFLRPEPGPTMISVATMREVAEAIRQDTAALKKFLEKIK